MACSRTSSSVSSFSSASVSNPHTYYKNGVSCLSLKPQPGLQREPFGLFRKHHGFHRLYPTPPSPSEHAQQEAAAACGEGPGRDAAKGRGCRAAALVHQVFAGRKEEQTSEMFLRPGNALHGAGRAFNMHQQMSRFVLRAFMSPSVSGMCTQKGGQKQQQQHICGPLLSSY